MDGVVFYPHYERFLIFLYTGKCYFSTLFYYKKQCNLFTDCIAFWVLAFFLEFGAAFGAGDDDLAFAAGDADFLTTVRTFVDMVRFAVR